MASSLLSEQNEMLFSSAPASDLFSSITWDDMKAKLQEYTQKENLPDPVYVTHESNGQPSKYEGVVVVGDHSFTGIPFESEEDAGVSAADFALVCLGIRKIIPEDEVTQGFRETKEQLDNMIAGVKGIKEKFQAEKADIGATSDDFGNLAMEVDESLQCLEGSMQILMQSLATRNQVV